MYCHDVGKSRPKQSETAGRTIIKCLIQREVHGKRRRGRPKSRAYIWHHATATSQNGLVKIKCGRNHAGLAGSRYIWGTVVRGATWAANRHSWRDRGRRSLSWTASNIIEWPTSFGFRLDVLNSFNRITENDAPRTGTKFVCSHKTDISISADWDFGEMKKTETPSKSRRVGRYAWHSTFM